MNKMHNLNKFQEFFTTQQLHNYINRMYNNDNKQQKLIHPQKLQQKFQSHIENQKFNHLTGISLEKYIIYAFSKNNQINSEIYIFSYRKKNGEKYTFHIKQLKGTINCLKFMLYVPQKQQNHTHQQSTFKLIVGFKQGFIKIINIQEIHKVQGVRLDVKPIISLIVPNYQKFHHRNICIALAQDYYIYFVDITKLSVVYILRPNLIMSDKALSIQINEEYSYLMQATQGGYLIFWKLAKVLQYLKQGIQDNKKPIPRQYNLFPSRVNHSIAVQGLIWCSFYHHMIAVITKSGRLKLIALNVKAEEQFICLLQYNITHPQYITYAQIYPSQDSIFVSKSKPTESIIQKLMISDELSINKRIIMKIEGLDTICDFFLPNKSSILMCRGRSSYAVGYSKFIFSTNNQQDYEQQAKNY